MAEQIGQAGSALNLRLGQVPSTQNPNYFTEFQLIYNALHLLGQYMDVLRDNLESQPNQVPSESLRFRRLFWAPAAQVIVKGAIVSPAGGGIVNGVLSNEVRNGISNEINDTIGGSGNRATWGVAQRTWGVALTDAAIGELVQVGIGPGVTQITGAKCGQLIWGVDSRAVLSQRPANDAGNIYTGRSLVGNGSVYLNNITNTHFFGPGAGSVHFEGYNSPGFPFNSGGSYFSSNIYLYPIGVCVLDGYVLLYDYKRSDTGPYFTP